MRVWLWGVLCCAACLPGVGRAESACPWINVATASGALDGPAELSVEQKEIRVEACTFVVGKGTAERRLYVAVRPTSDPQKDLAGAKEGCRTAPEPVRSLGNEAWSCRPRGLARGVLGVTIYGRVRETFFLVRMSGIADDAVLQDKASLAAEQVANNLY